MTEKKYSAKHEEIIAKIFSQSDGVIQFIKEQKEDEILPKETIIEFALTDIRLLGKNSYILVNYALEKEDSITYDESIHIYEFTDKQIRKIYDELQKL